MSETAQKILREAGWNELGQQIVTGFAEGIQAQEFFLINSVADMALASVEAVKNTLDINSPSRVFQELGNFTGLGFVNGLESYADKTYDAGSNMVEAAKSGLSNAIQTIADIVDGGLDWEPTIRPVLDLSNVSQGADELNNLFYAQRALGLAGQASMAFNAARSGDQTAVTVDNDDVVQELRILRGEMAEVAAAISRLKLVLDTGTLVGELADPMDSALGRKQTYKGRGI